MTVDEPGSTTLHTNGSKRDKLSVTKGAKDRNTSKQTTNPMKITSLCLTASVPCGLTQSSPGHEIALIYPSSPVPPFLHHIVD